MEPTPLWPEAPRFCPQKAFPPYRFTPGFNPHPTAHPQGHSYCASHQQSRMTQHRLGEESRFSPEPPSGESLHTTRRDDKFSENDWQTNDLYLFGIDLYHQGYLWESHEAWEELWHLTPKDGPTGQFLQALIQNSAALLKIHLKQWNAARHLSHEAWERLFQLVQNNADLFQNIQNEVFLGLNVKDLLASMQTYYTPLWQGREEIIGAPPKLILNSFAPSLFPL